MVFFVGFIIEHSLSEVPHKPLCNNIIVPQVPLVTETYPCHTERGNKFQDLPYIL